jgi:hypothetical protein
MPEKDYSQFYHLRHAEDLLHSISALKACKKAVFIQDILYNYTVNPNSVTQTKSIEKYKVNSTVRAMVWEFLLSEDVFSEKDWNCYQEYCYQLLKDELKTICNFEANWLDKINILDQINKDEYYKKVIYKGQKDWTLRLLGQKSTML